MRARFRQPAGLGTRAFRALLLLYPTAFRDEYGREMSLVFEDRYRDADGVLDRALLWLDALTGILIEAPKEHLRMAVHDLRYAFRCLGRSPGFAVTSVATLALAIGASTAMFSVLNAVLLRPLPYESPDRLVMVWTEIPSQGVREGRSAYWNVEQWRSQSRSFTDLAVSDPVSLILTQAGQREQISGLRASANLLPLLGVRPFRGRLFTSAEADDRRRLAVISHRFWQTRFGGSDDAIGRTLQLDGLSSEIIGILPEAIDHVRGADVWEPQTLFPDWDTRRAVSGAGGWFVVGRLRPGVSLDQARTEMNAIASRLDAELPAIARGRRLNLVPLSDSVTGATPRLVLWTLTGAALLLLLVAAANVAGLSLARSVGRVPEMAIRSALGASRARIVRLLLAESMTVAALSAVLGLLLAAAATRAIKVFGPANLARLQEADLGFAGVRLGVGDLGGDRRPRRTRPRSHDVATRFAGCRGRRR